MTANANAASSEAAATPKPRATQPKQDGDYLLDAVQRSFMFFETLLNRGDNYLEHLEHGTPTLLQFAHELVLDGHCLPEPCNYALLRLMPPDHLSVNPGSRPVIVVDPRAGSGPGVGAFKLDSEVGVAMRAGHPVYLVTFKPEPEGGQAVLTVAHAEARFIEAVIALHPGCDARPVVIGNCQAGWAMMALAAMRPELFGPLMIMGAPISDWAGGSKLNPMRYVGGMLGGSWLNSLTTDLEADHFDKINLVGNYERLNQASALWNKYHNLWSHIDTQSQRFREFERWWSGYFRISGAETESIVENLFIGNQLAHGTAKEGQQAIDLRNITAPVVVFATWGDNITPPPQALDWIIDTWGDERAIAAAGRTVVYALHDSIGHLGIFAGTDMADAESGLPVTSLDIIERLPPGLYEMKLKAKAGREAQPRAALQPDDYTVHYEHRSMQDILAINPEGRAQQAIFSTIAKVSEANAKLYKTWMRPWLQLTVTRPLADALGKLHSMRLQRQLLSDTWPMAPIIRSRAAQARARRAQVSDDHPLRQLEQLAARQITEALQAFRDQRDKAVVDWSRLIYGPQGLGAFIKPGTPDADAALARALEELQKQRDLALQQVAQGGFAEAVGRIVLSGMLSIGAFEQRSLRLAHLLAQVPSGLLHDLDARTNWVELLKQQARITAVAPVEALNALEQLLPDQKTRETALAISAAVMMSEPALANPRAEIIEFLMGKLGVDPDQVMVMARHLATPLNAAPDASAPAAAGKKTGTVPGNSASL